ncbi:AAA family ATPase [Agrococcus sediminis]|uniref:AAA family ATPase n=1 Tax=Agrococcus sediminis TaxID=2599924 RepID=A0A5M8QG09_9MICO|nr:AAA family ATPase [Agrococcus sediminis]KAA6434929.1 AAA family ATPase [Agrococcus sediminis]
MPDHVIPRKGRRSRAHAVDDRSYSAEQVVEALGSRFVGEPSGDEQMLWCPVCEDPATSKSASASVNLADMRWWCYTRAEENDHRLSLGSVVRQFTSFDAAPTGQLSAPSARPIPALVPLPNQNKPYEWHDQMMAKYPERVEYLKTQRGLTVETIERFKLGWDGKRYMIPVRQGLGPWHNVRRYKPGGDPKMLNVKDHGTAALAFTETLSGNTLPVLVAEGEMDAMLAWQKAEGLYAVVTGTGGAGKVPDDLSKLAGREVFVYYDNDNAGHEGAETFARRALAAGVTAAHVLDVCELGVERGHVGGDLTVAFMSGATGSGVLAQMEKARERAADAADPIRAAVQVYFDNHADDARQSLIDDALDDDQVMALPPAGYVIDGWVPEGFFTNLYGAPGAKKTFVMLDMLRHIATGQPWHGHEVRQGAAVLFEGEGLAQLGARIDAWNVVHDPPRKPPIKYVSTPVNLTAPEGVARVVRTVMDVHERLGQPVVAVAFDPLVEYMSGDENAEGTELATRGLRALARVLEDLTGSPVAVLVGAHTNAAGERARGTDHPRMRSGAHIRVESLASDRVGLVQEKQKNGPLLAVQLDAEVVALPDGEASLVMRLHRQMSAAEYAAEKVTGERQHREQSRKLMLSEKQAEARAAIVPALLGAVSAEPGIALNKLKARARGNGKSSEYVEDVITELVESGQILREIEIGGRGSHRHFPGSGATDA